MALTIDHVPAPHDHVVQFYDADDELSARVVPYLANALQAAGEAIVIATESHRRTFAAGLGGAAAGVVWLDAGEAMAALLVDGRLARHQFDKAVGDVVREAAARAGAGPVHAYGEIVALMWASGHVTAALELEDQWNDLARELDFSLYCAYPLATVEAGGDADAVRTVCRQHSVVVGPPAARSKVVGNLEEVARTFPPVGYAPTQARRFVSGALAAWGRLDLVGDAAVVVTELATNAVLHAGTDFTVTAARSAEGGIRIAVHDGSGSLPRARSAGPLDGSGRGLRLVDALAADWGSEVSPDGKVVWADFLS